jgi:hypothetical protein
VVSVTREELQDKEGAFGHRMPRLKAAGMDGWRLEFVAHLVMLSPEAADAFSRFVVWITADHAPGSGPSDQFMALYCSAQLLPFRKAEVRRTQGQSHPRAA